MSDPVRVAVVTGTSHGLGFATAHKLLAEGYIVVGASRSATQIDDRRFHQCEVDLVADGACERLIRDVISTYGRVDLLVNNAAAIEYRNCWEYEPDEVAALLHTNLTAPFLLSREVARHWLANGVEGVIVNVCSVESEVAWRDPPQAAYAVTKGGLHGLTRSLAHDLAPAGIRVNAVAPGIIDTDMTPQSGASPIRRIPQGRLAEPREIADVIAFVASPASSYMTGEIVFVDGGYRLP